MALTAEGVPFTEYSGWTTRGRDGATGEPFGEVHGILNHHTAGSNSLRAVAVDGAPALPAPLAHTFLPKSGVAVLVSCHRANHAGLAALNSYTAIVNETAIPKPSKASGTVDGNDRLYGIEVENLGDDRDTYTRAQYDTWVRWNAALCRHHGWGAGSCAGHLETSVEGKVDPRGPVEGYGRRGRFTFTTAQLRADVHERLEHPASWSPDQASTPPKEITMTGPAYLNLGITGYELAPDLWDDVEFTAEWTDETGDHAANSAVFIKGPARFSGSLSLRLDHLPVGDSVQVRMTEYDGDTVVQDHPIHEVIGTPGGTYSIVSLVKRLGAGRSMRVRLLNQSTDGIEVASAVLSALAWKES
ncbi:N-acetylmuramoyl-L-alanine amidase [Streptomyces sp. NPDC001068]|uniref:N-acetylmuramoyl-L-alanine amidase n=1 Tax=Streptomyces sp. NPDC001068 TaxID=3364544 RepID=UPI0036760B78